MVYFLNRNENICLIVIKKKKKNWMTWLKLLKKMRKKNKMMLKMNSPRNFIIESFREETRNRTNEETNHMKL
jgi:hypothetical protein